MVMPRLYDEKGQASETLSSSRFTSRARPRIVGLMYDSDGKRRARDLVVEVAETSGCRTFLDFWGGGASARQATVAGLTVTSAEKDRALQAGLVADAEVNGYSAHLGDAVDIDQKFDFVFADFCGNANPTRFKELGALATKTNRWLAVTLAPDWQMNESMQGDAATFTVPAWLVGATGMRLAYVSRYVRNERGVTMWLVLLEVRPTWSHPISKSGIRAGTEYDPRSVARHLTLTRPQRGTYYWASPRFAKDFPKLNLRKAAIWRPHATKTQRTCLGCATMFVPATGIQVRCKSGCGYKSPRVQPTKRRCATCRTEFITPTRLRHYCRDECRPSFGRTHHRVDKAS